MTTRLTTRGTTRLLTRGTSPGAGFDADAQAIIDALTTAGATITSEQRAIIDAFYVSNRASGALALLKNLRMPIWGSAAPNAIDWITLASGTWVGGVTHAAGYMQGNGTTGYLDTGADPSALGLTTTSGGSGLILVGGGGSVNQVMMAFFWNKSTHHKNIIIFFNAKWLKEGF